MSENIENYFTPVPQSELIKQFKEKNPEANFDDKLEFLINNFPQVDGNGVNYLVEGGAAIELLTPGSRGASFDIDLISPTTDISEALVNSGIFDVKSPQQWLEFRGLEATKRNQDMLMSSFTRVEKGGKEVLILSPDMLALSKQLPYSNREPRDKDLEDFKILNIGQEDIDEAINKFLGV